MRHVNVLKYLVLAENLIFYSAFFSDYFDTKLAIRILLEGNEKYVVI